MRPFASYLCLSLAAMASLAQKDDFKCPDEFEGYYPHDLSCDKYWECKSGTAKLETCGNGLAFADLDPTYTTKNCDYLYNVECGARTEIEPAISAANCPRLYGTFEDPEDCAGFFQCRDGISNRFSCAPGLAWDIETRVCKWADQVKRCKELKKEEAKEGDEEAFTCPNNVPVGIFSKHAHPADCRQYYVCIAGVPREYGCPLGTVFKIGGDEFDGKCSDPADVPECANYYGELAFDKQELVRAGVDPEAVGARVNAPERVKVNRPINANQARPTTTTKASVAEEDQLLGEEEKAPEIASTARPITRTNSNSFRNRPSKPAAAVKPEAAAETTTATSTTVSKLLIPAEPSNSSPINSIPITRTSLPAAPTSSPFTLSSQDPVVAIVTTASPAPVEVPAIPLQVKQPAKPEGGLPLVPAAAAADGKQPAGGSLGQPVKVKAGEDYYYYYYYDDEEGAEGEKKVAAGAAHPNGPAAAAGGAAPLAAVPAAAAAAAAAAA